MQEHIIKFGQSGICYRTAGNGGTAVLLHGFTESQEIWADFASALSAQFSVITIDLPGHGRSECTGDIHTMELFADVVKHVLDHNSITQCVLIGHSMGGYAALAFAEKYPEMMSGLCLFHSSALADTPEGRENRQRAIDAIRQSHTSFVSAFIPDLFAPGNREKYKNEIAQLVSSAKTMSIAAIVAAQEGMKLRPDRTHVLAFAKYPVLFIAGKQDSRVPYEKILYQAGLPNDSALLTLGDVAHMGYIEARGKTLSAVTCFLQGIYGKDK